MARLNEEIFKAEASKPYEHQILIYLEQNASDELVAKMNGQTEKNIQNCFSYIRDQARKQASGGCACIEDKAVYGWAIHYFEEDEIKPSVAKAKTDSKPPKKEDTSDNGFTEEDNKAIAEAHKRNEERKKAKEAPVPEKKQQKKQSDIEGQFNLFDFLGGD